MRIKIFFVKLKNKTVSIFRGVGDFFKAAWLRTLNFFKYLGSRIYCIYCKRPLLFCITAALLSEFFIETVSRHSLFEGLKFTFLSPIVFLYNALIIFAIFAISLVIKRGIATFTTVFLIWNIFGVANAIILFNRPSPFAAADFLILPTVLEIITVYLTIPEIIIIAVGLIGVLTGMVFLWIKAPKREPSYKKHLITLGTSAVLLGILTPMLVFSGLITSDYSNILKAYEKNGFPYSFSRSLFSRGISKPRGYSEETINGILNRIGEKIQPDKNFESPNIIYVQLESLFDLSAVNGITVSENPLPNFTALKENNPSGFISVPLCGSGTANTEFEILTGISTEFFSPGEYPYITVMRDTVCESTPFILKGNGYKTHSMHNNTGVFYDRNLIYPNLGFDSFTPIEYMYDIEYNELGWAKDSVFIDEIQKTLESTEEKDFVFAVSVQPHGAYPTEKVADYPITVTGEGMSEEYKNMYTYYVNQIKGSDEMIGKLTEFYSNYHEKTVIVFYGDHLPDLKLEEEDLKEGDLYQTEYILWSNYGAFDSVPDKDIEAFQLSAYVFELLGLNENIGVINSVHRYLSNEEDYKNIMELIEYDVLFGEQYSIKDKEYNPTNIKFGISVPKIEKIILEGDTLTVKGEWFNPFSVIYIDGKRYETKYISINTVVAENVKIKEGKKVSVAQEANDGTVFTETNNIVYVK